MFKKLIKSFGYAFRGIGLAIRDELNMRIHVVAVLTVTIAGIFTGLDATEWSAIFLCYGLVLAMETMNSAVENLVDLVHPENNPKAGKIKDMAAGAVLLTAIISTAVAVSIFGNKLFNELL